MKRSDRIRLNFTRNFRLPGKERAAKWLQPSEQLRTDIKDGIVWLKDEDIAIYTTADNYIEWAIITTGTYEDEINKLIRVSLNPGDFALDIGANIGLQSLRMSKCVGPNGKIFSFEPLLHLQAKLCNNMILNKASNVVLFPYALSNSEKEEEFKIDKNTWNQGAFSIDHKGTGHESQHVSIKVADDIKEINHLSRLDLIKIDVEGFEYPVLLGLKNTIGKHLPRIIFEYDDNYWRLNGFDIKDCIEFLHSFNYRLYQITTAGCELISNHQEAKAGNFFAVTS